MLARILFILALICGGPAAAQLPLPQLPPVGDVLDDATNNARDTLNDVDLTRLRQAQVQHLLRQHPRELERGPEGFPIVRSQIIALSTGADALDRAGDAGFEIVSSEDAGLGAIVILRAPRGMSTRRALRHLREADPPGTYDFDHLHLESGASAGAKQASTPPGAGPRIGLIDSGVDAPVAAQRAFATSAPVAAAHGGAVASLLRSAAPGAQLYVADIYGGAPTGGASSALARALAWLAAERTPVINISLVGPRNRVIEALVAQMAARGFIIVAAVGNDGPAAAPLYPAAYPGVVGVTGVDARGRALIEAVRGPQVDFAALGIVGAGRRHGVRGTSYAAPIVAGVLATRIDAPDAARAQGAVAALRGQARDLGDRGRDDTYGDGLIEIAPANLAAH